MNADGSEQEVFANTTGRVLGFAFDAQGNLIAADAVKGLLSISPDRKVTVLTDHVDEDPIRYADAVVVAKNGKLYFSDASTGNPPNRPKAREVEFSKKEVLREEVKIYRQPDHGCVKAC